MDPSYYDRNDNDVAGQGAFSLLCHLHPDVPSVQRFVPLVQDFGNTSWSFATRVCEPRASILDVTDRWQGVYSVAVGIPDEGRNTIPEQMTFKDNVNRRVSARKYGVHKVQILGNKTVEFGDLALLGPAVHAPTRKLENPKANPFVGVYPVKRRTIFFPRQDELKDVADKTDAAAAQALCIKYCPWTRVPALAFAFQREGKSEDVSDYEADYYNAAIAKPEKDRDVFEWALANEYKQIKDLKTEDAYALYQWMMVSQMIGVFISPAEATSYAQILLM